MIKKALLTLVITSMIITLVSAIASLQVTSFSCTPSETAINEAFSCTAQIQNSGDVSGTLGTAILYPDSANWLENSNYPKTANTQIGVGQSTEVTFTSLRATTTGSNGFQKITLDDVTDTYVSDENININIIDVAVTATNSESSEIMGGTWDVTAEATAGGSISVSLAFAANSGGCSIGSQTNPKTISGMTDGSKQSRTWTITMGTSGDCDYTISAQATGIGGVGTKTDTANSVVDCTDCPVASSSSSGGGGGGGGGGAAKYSIGTLTEEKSFELSKHDTIAFIIDDENHTVKLIELTDTTIKLTIKSNEQNTTMSVGETKQIDLEGDGTNDITIKLVSINRLLKTAKLTVAPLRTSRSSTTGNAAGDEDLQLSPPENNENKESSGSIGSIVSSKPFIWSSVIVGAAIIVVIILSLLGVIKWKRYKEEDKNRRVRYYSDKQ